MDKRFSLLFQPVQIGPVTAPNRFYQVPHCNGFGHRLPHGMAAMRGMKAEGGWGVVHTEEVEVHHTTDLSPYFEGRLWNDDGIPALQLMTEAVHKYGTLAGIELAYNGHDASNLYSRAAPFDLRSRGIVGASGYEPGQSRAARKDDIKQIRKWHRNAAIRAKRAGFDNITCYAAHNLSLALGHSRRGFCRIPAWTARGVRVAARCNIRSHRRLIRHARANCARRRAGGPGSWRGGAAGTARA